MAHTKKDLQNSIAEMKSVYTDADTPQSIKDSIKPSLEKAEALLKELEDAETPAAKPTAAEIVKATKKGKQKVKKAKISASHQKTLQQIVSESKELKKLYGNKSEGALKRDAKRSAKKPGSRTSASGNKYREYRGNRSDVNSKAPHLAKGGVMRDISLKLGNMKKPQGFTLYPYSGGDTIFLQSDKRWITANLRTGVGKMSNKNHNYPGSHTIVIDPIEIKLPEDVLKNIQSYLWDASGIQEVGPGVLINNEELFSNTKNTFAKGGAIADNAAWNIVGLNRPPNNFTPAAIKEFEKAFALLEKEDKESAYYKSAAAALGHVVSTVQTLYVLKSTNKNDSAIAHKELQMLGVQNYKTGLLLDTSWLNKELAERHLAKGGRVDPKQNDDDDDEEFEEEYNDEDLGGTGHGDISHSDADPGLKKGGRLKSATNRDRAYRSDEPWEQNYRRKSSPKNPRYKTMARGGKIKRNLSRDRKFKSQEPHEQKYKRKTSPKNPTYKKAKGRYGSKGRRKEELDAAKRLIKK